MASDPDFEELLQIIKSGSTFESLRAARKLAELSRTPKSTEERIRELETELKELRESSPVEAKTEKPGAG